MPRKDEEEEEGVELEVDVAGIGWEKKNSIEFDGFLLFSCCVFPISILFVGGSSDVERIGCGHKRAELEKHRWEEDAAGGWGKKNVSFRRRKREVGVRSKKKKKKLRQQSFSTIHLFSSPKPPRLLSPSSMSASLAISSTRGALASSSWRPSSSSINGGINGAGSTSNLAVAATSVSLSRQPLLRRRQKQKQTLLVAASLVGFNRPSPPWPSSMRGSPSFPARELDNGTVLKENARDEKASARKEH
mgnify:CR=1 FL=1|jgi:hypothetical protein